MTAGETTEKERVGVMSMLLLVLAPVAIEMTVAMEEKSPSPPGAPLESITSTTVVMLKQQGAGPNTVPGLNFFENWLWSYNIEWFVRFEHC